MVSYDTWSVVTTVVSYDTCGGVVTTVVSYDTSRCRATAVSCDGPEVSYDGLGGVVRRTTHSCDVVQEKYVTRMNSQFHFCGGGNFPPPPLCGALFIFTTINLCR